MLKAWLRERNIQIKDQRWRINQERAIGLLMKMKVQQRLRYQRTQTTVII
jgi:hypothetical protein